MHDMGDRPARPGRGLLGWLTVAAAVVIGLGYAREVAIALGVPASAIGGKLFALDAERNVPAWFTVLLLLTVSGMMLRTALREFSLRLMTAWGWLVLAVGFFYLAADEQMGLHEGLGRFAGDLPQIGLFYYHWVWVALALVAAIGVAFIPFLLRLPRDTAFRLVVAGAFYVGGSAGFEIVGGIIASAYGESAGLYIVAGCIEETLEIVGVLLAVRCLVLHLASLPVKEARPALRDTSGAVQ